MNILKDTEVYINYNMVFTSKEKRNKYIKYIRKNHCTWDYYEGEPDEDSNTYPLEVTISGLYSNEKVSLRKMGLL